MSHKCISDAPPLRLALREDAVSAVEEKLQSVKAELDQWRSVSLNTAFAGVTVGALSG